ncbi:MAG: FGGY family carbohydrate kinase [Methanobacteriota archaeon]
MPPASRMLLLALDCGTTSTRALLVAPNGRIVAEGSARTPLSNPRPGWAESPPDALLSSTLAAVRSALRRAKGGDVAAIGITNQRETTILWDEKTGKAVGPAISWQCRRTADLCASLRKEPGIPERVREKTGLVLDPYFSATKIRWLLEHERAARELAAAGRLRFGTVDSWVLFHLTGVHATDASNASRTLLYSIRESRFDKELCEIFAVPPDALPEVRASAGSFGTVARTGRLGTALRALEGVKVAGIAGDQQASLFGHGCRSVGEAKCTLGTGAFLLAPVDEAPRNTHGLVTTVAWDLGSGGRVGRPTYALEGSLFACGAALDWLVRVGVLRTTAESETLARRVKDTGGVSFVPALVGLGAPHWDADARAAWLGISTATKREHLVRAVLEALALQNAEVVHAFAKAAGTTIRELRVDGGVSKNRLLCALTADFSGARVRRSRAPDTTALGAAFLAGVGAGLYPLREAPSVPTSPPIRPRLRPSDREEALATFRRAVATAQSF